MKIGWLNKEYIQLFQERLSEKVYATIPKGIVGDFKFTVFQGWKSERIAREALERLRVLKESRKKSRFESYSVWKSALSYPILPFGIVACTVFPTTFLEMAVS